MAAKASEVGAALWWAEILSVDMDSPPGTGMAARSHNLLVFLYLTNDLSLLAVGPLCHQVHKQSWQGHVEP